MPGENHVFGEPWTEEKLINKLHYPVTKNGLLWPRLAQG